jgi:hypothetical protein
MSQSTLGRTIGLAALSLVAAPAFAAVSYLGGETAFEPAYEPSTVTRSEVLAELQRAQRDGELLSNYEISAPYFASHTASQQEPRHPVFAVMSIRPESAFDDSIYSPNG